MRVAVLDACVLYRGTVTDIMLNLADVGLFDPIWSAEISSEWKRNLLGRGHIPADRIAHRHTQMDRAFPAARCDAPEDILAQVLAVCRTAAEAKDAHVVATAYSAGADTLVTYNHRDFPPHMTDGFGLSVSSPERFIMDLAAEDPEGVLSAIAQHQGSLRHPPYSRDAYLDLLSSAKADLPQLRHWLEVQGHRGSDRPSK